MDHPGESIYQGSDSFQLDTSAQQRLEEEETYKDQEIRNKELENLLTHAFDDLIDEDENDTDSEISTENENSVRIMDEGGGGDASVLSLRTQCHRPTINKDYGIFEPCDENQVYRRAGFNSTEQLQVLYEVRVREILRLTKDVDKWQCRAALLEAEQERSKLSLTEHADLLATAKGRISELEAEVMTLKENVLNLENSNSVVAKELQLYQTTATDLQSQLSLLQRGNGPDSFTDSLFRATHQKHQKEVLSLQDQLQAATSKLAMKTVECESLVRKVGEVTKAQEELLIEKANTISKLSHNLELSQRQIQQLIGSEEIIKHYETSDVLENSETDSMIHLGIGVKKIPSNNTTDQNAHLKDELKRCIAGYKLKSREIKSLRGLLEDRATVINSLQDQERRLTHQISTFSDDAANIIQELECRNERENELMMKNAQLTEDIEALKSCNEQMKQEIAELNSNERREQLQQIDHHSNEFLQFHDITVAKIRRERNENLEEKIRHLSVDLKVALAENDCTKQLYVDLCSTKDLLVDELATLKNELITHSNQPTTNDAGVQTTVKDEIENSQMKCLEGECSRLNTEIIGLKTLVDKYQKDLLRSKAELEDELQEKLKLMLKVNQMMQVSNRENSVNAALETIGSKSADKKLDLQKASDDQMEVSTKNHLEELKEMEKVTKKETKLLYSVEIQVMQQREEALLKELKQYSVKLTEAEHNLKMLNKQSAEAIKHIKIKLIRVYQECNLNSEKLKVSEENFSTFQKNCVEKFNKMKAKYRTSTEKLKCKYKAAKKLALDYKLFAERKEEHLKSEWQRMEGGYNNALLEVQQRMQSLVKD